MMQATTSRNQRSHRVGMIVPSSNTTMETEIPELLRRQSLITGASFTFHSARLRLLQVTPEALQAMNACATDAVDALSDAQVDCMMYACLVAAMHGGRQSVEDTGSRLSSQAISNGNLGPVITSAGALVGALKMMGVQRAAMITPYKKALTQKVADTLGEYGIGITQSHSLEVVDNAAVGRLNPQNLIAIAADMDLTGADALILSACVQMPSLSVIDEVEQMLGLPVISAATATAFTLLQSLGMEPAITGAGSLLQSAQFIKKSNHHYAAY